MGKINKPLCGLSKEREGKGKDESGEQRKRKNCLARLRP
jgi:hypothetical protein